MAAVHLVKFPCTFYGNASPWSLSLWIEDWYSLSLSQAQAEMGSQFECEPIELLRKVFCPLCKPTLRSANRCTIEFLNHLALAVLSWTSGIYQLIKITVITDNHNFSIFRTFLSTAVYGHFLDSWSGVYASHCILHLGASNRSSRLMWPGFLRDNCHWVRAFADMLGVFARIQDDFFRIRTDWTFQTELKLLVIVQNRLNRASRFRSDVKTDWAHA